MAFWDKWFSTKDSTLADLQASVAGGDLEEVKKLIAAGAAVNTRDTGGQTLLEIAVKNGEHGVAKTLLNLPGGADFNNVAPNAGAATVTQDQPSVALKDDIEVGKPLTFKNRL